MRIIKKVMICGLGIVAAAAALRLSLSVSYGAEIPPYGLLVTGRNVEGTQGFHKNIIYLSGEDVEQLKENKNPQAYGLGDCWLGDARYSSYDNHGTGNYHYTLAEGINVPGMIEAAVPARAEIYYLYSSDSYSTKMRLSDTGSMKYFAPGDAQGVLSSPPMIALYKTTVSGDPESGAVPEGLPERLPQGQETFVYGQRTREESNNCHFIHGANAVVVDEPVSVLRSDSNKYSILRLYELLALGSRDRDYCFTVQGQESVHQVRGVPLWEVLTRMRLDTYMPEGFDTRLELCAEDGRHMFIDRETAADCMVVWDYSDGMACPEEQTGEMAVYLPGKTREEAILFNLAKVNVTDADGTILTGPPAPSATPDITPDVTPEQPKPLPAPASFKASAASYQSIRLKWEKSAGADGYYIYRCQRPTGKYKKIKTLKASASSCQDTGLKVNTTYQYKIRAWKKETGTLLLGSLSRAVSAKPVLEKPQIQKFVRTKTGTVKLKWKSVPGASGYEIYRSSKKNSGYQKAGQVKKKSVYTFSGHASQKRKKKTFYYKVRPFRKVNGSCQYGPFSRAVKES